MNKHLGKKVVRGAQEYLFLFIFLMHICPCLSNHHAKQTPAQTPGSPRFSLALNFHIFPFCMKKCPGKSHNATVSTLANPASSPPVIRVLFLFSLSSEEAQSSLQSLRAQSRAETSPTAHKCCLACFSSHQHLMTIPISNHALRLTIKQRQGH